MSAFIAALVLCLLVAVAVIALAAFPHRPGRVPGPPPVSAALERVGGRVTKILEESSRR